MSLQQFIGYLRGRKSLISKAPSERLNLTVEILCDICKKPIFQGDAKKGFCSEKCENRYMKRQKNKLSSQMLPKGENNKLLRKLMEKEIAIKKFMKE